MKKLLLALALFLAPASAWAQCTGIFAPNTYCGNNSASPAPPSQISGSTSITGPGTSVVNDLALWNNLTGTALKDSPPAAFTSTNDTNIIATLGGSPNTALVNAMSITFGWTGTLAAARLNANVVQAITNDTNVTGSITAQNLTLGWTGTLSSTRGGTGANNSANTGFATWNAGVLGSVGVSATVLPLSNGGTGASAQATAAAAILPTPTRIGDIVYWDGTIWNHLAGNNSGTQVFQENSVGVPSWATISGTGTVTSVASTYPICGGTFTSSGTLTYCGPTFSGVLTFVSATAVKFSPYQGDTIRINTVVYQIPAAGITGCANTSVFVNGTGVSNLAASTLYYVYAFNNSGTITCDFSTTGHTTDVTGGNIGTEIETGVSSRSLIGMILTNSSSQFVSSPTSQFVRSWFNRRSLASLSNTSGSSIGLSASSVELSTSLRINFLLWANEVTNFACTCQYFSATNGSILTFQLVYDNSTIGLPLVINTDGTGHVLSAGLSDSRSTLSEGSHWVTLFGSLNSGTASMYLNTYLSGTVTP